MGAAFGWPNWIDEAGVTLGGGTWEADLPRTNAIDPRLSVVARTDGVLTTDTVLTIDLGAARTVGVLALIGHTLSAAATVRWRGNSSADMTTPLYDSTALDAFPVQWEPGMLYTGHPNAATRRLTDAQIDRLRWDVPHVLTAATAARYWQCNIADATNADGFVQIGRVWASPLYQPSINYRYGASFGVDVQSIVGRALNASRYVDERPDARTRVLEFADNEPGETETVLGDLQRSLGLSGQVYYVDDPTATTNMQRTAFLAVQSQLSPVVRASLRQSGITLSLEEVR